MAEIAPNWRSPALWGLLIFGAGVSFVGWPNAGVWPLAFLGPGVLFACALSAKTPGEAFYRGYFYGFGFFTALLYWLTGTLVSYGNLPIPVGFCIFFLLIFYLSLFPGLCGWVVNKVGQKSILRGMLVAPFAYVGFDWLRSWLFTGFGWGDLAQAFWRVGPALDLMPRVGAEGLCLIAAFISTGITFGALKLLKGDTPLPNAKSALAPCLVALAAIPLLLLLPPGTGEPVKNLKVAIIQGNISQSQKWNPGYVDDTIAKYLSMTAEALKAGPVDFVLWPETAMPFYWEDTSQRAKNVKKAIAGLKTPVIFGAPALRPHEGVLRSQNSLFYVDENGVERGRYDKMHLVPFGEYVPLGKFLAIIKSLVEAAGDFLPGTNFMEFDLQSSGARVAPLICFESIFSTYATRHAQNGANVIALVTNDGWFGNTSAPEQHLAYAALRAAETGLPVVRCANTGISAAFNARGRPLATTKLNETVGFVAEVDCPAQSYPLQRKIRPLIGPSCIIAIIAGLYLSKNNKRP